MKKYLTKIVAKAELLEPNEAKFKAVASKLKSTYGFELKPQIDLLYVRSCLVTNGINDNDDIFLKEELWNARHTPIMKPDNWQHNDKDIVGVMYSVSAQDLNGNEIPFDQEEVPDIDFELITESVVFKLIHPEKAKLIVDRHAQGNLFVSMEAWFDDYSYGLYNDDKTLDKVVARNQDTNFLDSYLRANKGVGQYEGKRIGRALKGITFGGKGYVDVPANKRSDIFEVKNLETAASIDEVASDQVAQLLHNLIVSQKEKKLMTASAEHNAVDSVTIASKVTEELDKREAAKAEKAQKEALEVKAANLEKENLALKGTQATLEAKVTELEGRTFDFSALDNLVKTLSGATPNTPAEISKIDSASDGNAAFNAKISWIQNSVASLLEKVTKASKLEEELAVAAKLVRASEIRALFASKLNDNEIEALVTIGTSLDDEAYESWIAEKEFFAAALDGKAAKEPMSNDKKKMPVKKDDKNVSCSEIYAALLANRRSDGSQGFHQPGSLGIDSGAAGSFPRTPRHKISGSTANADPADLLENAEEINGVNLAGAGMSENEESPFATLARELFSVEDDNSDKNKES